MAVLASSTKEGPTSAPRRSSFSPELQPFLSSSCKFSSKRTFTLYSKHCNPLYRLDVLPFIFLYVVCILFLIHSQISPPPSPLLPNAASPWFRPSSLTCLRYSLSNHTTCPRTKFHYRPSRHWWGQQSTQELKALVETEQLTKDLTKEELLKAFLLSNLHQLDNNSVCFSSSSCQTTVCQTCQTPSSSSPCGTTSSVLYVSDGEATEEDEAADSVLNRSGWVWFYCMLLVALGQAAAWLAGEWSVRVRALLAFRQLPLEEVATSGSHLLVACQKMVMKEKDAWGSGTQYLLCEVMRDGGGGDVFIIHEKKKFIYQKRGQMVAGKQQPPVFQPVKFPTALPASLYLQHRGLSTATPGGGVLADAAATRRYYGQNDYDMPMPKFMDLFKEHAVSPFFVFQLLCVGLWMLDDYWRYGVVTLLMLAMLEVQLVKKRLKELQEFRQMRQTPYFLPVYRGSSWLSLSSDQLLPGDLCCLYRPERGGGDEVCPADCLLLQGTAVVNESMLTGESVTQMKVAIDNNAEVLDMKVKHRHNILFAGTKLVMHKNSEKTFPSPQPHGSSGGGGSSITVPRGGCLCYVLRTGFHTTQGKLVRTILFSSERVTVSSREALYFLLILLMFAISAALYVLHYGLTQSALFTPNLVQAGGMVAGGEHDVLRLRSRWKLLLSCSHIITAVVPPEFPITLSLAVTMSLLAMVQKKIFCTEPFRVPFAGRVSVCAFDKTGTLTSDVMEVAGLVGLSSWKHKPIPSKGFAPLPAPPPPTTKTTSTTTFTTTSITTSTTTSTTPTTTTTTGTCATTRRPSGDVIHIGGANSHSIKLTSVASSHVTPEGGPPTSGCTGPPTSCTGPRAASGALQRYITPKAAGRTRMVSGGCLFGSDNLKDKRPGGSTSSIELTSSTDHMENAFEIVLSPVMGL
eukprot:GHVS01014936.1.p1 GENE.GHVS01014936.1~~GHVS01014936.1.p1  ORF type:complete len:912 (-),score=250.18 GHVS01014936.1:178-2913(-)